MAVVTSYATLLTAIADYLARDDLTTFVPNFVQNAENKLYRRLNIRDMETAFSDTVSSGALALPTRYNALKYAYVDQSPVCMLKRVTPEFIYEKYPVRTTTGTPIYIARSGDEFIFGPASSDVTIAGVYYRRYEPLRTTDPNWYVTNAPEVLLYASLLEAEPFIGGDSRLISLFPIWERALRDAVKSITDSEMDEDYSGSTPYTVAA